MLLPANPWRQVRIAGREHRSNNDERWVLFVQRHMRGETTWLGHDVIVDEHDDLSISRKNTRISCRRGPGIFLADNPQREPSRELRQHLVGAVGRSVRYDDHLKGERRSRACFGVLEI